MQSRIPNPAISVPGAMDALLALSKSATKAGIPHHTLELVHLRASQINGCAVCVDMHAKDLQRTGESLERIFAVGAWREAPYYTDAERAALALTESVTRLADRADAVPDDVWAEAAAHYDDGALGGAGDRHRRDQRLEPDQRGHPPGRRRLGGLIPTWSPRPLRPGPPGATRVGRCPNRSSSSNATATWPSCVSTGPAHATR